MSKNKSEVGFVSHLAELRQRLINSLIFLTVLFILSYFFETKVYRAQLIIANDLLPLWKF